MSLHCLFQHNGKRSPWLSCDADQTGGSVSVSIIQISFGSSQKAPVEVTLLIAATSIQPHWVNIPNDSPVTGVAGREEVYVIQHIIYIFHNRSYRIISNKGQYFNFGKTFNWNIYKTWPYLMSSSMIWRREKQWVKHNHYLCEAESYCQLQQGQRHSGKGQKGHEDMMGRDMIFRLKRGREEIIQNCLQ